MVDAMKELGYDKGVDESRRMVADRYSSATKALM